MNMNFEIYGKRKPSLDEIRIGQQTFFNSDFLSPGDTILDIGGAAGRNLEAINRNLFPIKGTILDSDIDCIEYGRKTYPHIEFIHGEFPDVNIDRKFQLVSMQALFPQLQDWKRSIFEMVKLSKKYMLVHSLNRIYGNTVDDPDVSFMYYLDTGKRNPQVILNINEFACFLCLKEIRAKHIWFIGGHSDGYRDVKKALAGGKQYSHAKATMGHAFRCVNPYELITGNWFIELWKPDEEYPKRMGGVGNMLDVDGYSFYTPDIDIIIDEKHYMKVQDKEVYCDINWFRG